MYIRDANIILVVYDITNKDSFIHTEHWVNETKDLKREDAIFVLVGNKIDLEENRIVSTKEAEDFATEKGFLFYEVSAKTGEKVEDLFNNKIYPEMARKYNIGDEDEENGENDQQNAGNDNKGVKLNEPNNQPKKKGGCCGGGKNKKAKVTQNQEGEAEGGTQGEQ